MTYIKFQWETRKAAADEKNRIKREEEEQAMQEEALNAQKKAALLKALEDSQSTGHEYTATDVASVPIQPSLLQMIGVFPMPTVVKRPPVKSRFFVDSTIVQQVVVVLCPQDTDTTFYYIHI